MSAVPDGRRVSSRRWLLAVALAVFGVMPAGCSSKSEAPLPAAASRKTDPTAKPEVAPDAEAWFEDVTHRSGVSATYRSGQEGKRFFSLEIVGGGAAVADFDADGDYDLVLPAGGRIDAGTGAPSGEATRYFEKTGPTRFLDRTADSGLAASMYTHGCAVGDFDRDGRPDLCVTGFGGIQLFQNAGAGRFRDVTGGMGAAVTGWCTAAAFADLDRDGWLDLYIGRYLDWSPETDRACRTPYGQREVCGPYVFGGVQNVLLKNRGDGTFEDVSAQFGLASEAKTLGVLIGDINADGWPDVYVANDTTNKHLYLGSDTLPWQEAAVASGVATNWFGKAEGSMGVDLGDVDGDSRPELWVTNFTEEDNALYHNEGGGQFTYGVARFGLGEVSRLRVGFGTAMADFDHDGWLDLVVANGHVFYSDAGHPYAQLPQLFRNEWGTRFEDVTARGGGYFREPHVGRGLVTGDWDEDGALDLLIVHQNKPAALLRNRRAPPHFVKIALSGRESGREAIGAIVSFALGETVFHRHLRAGGGYLSHSDERVVVPAADAGPVDVTVTWPASGRERFRSLETGRTHTLIEGQGERL